MIHRDIKPGNIIICHTGHQKPQADLELADLDEEEAPLVKLLDFGIAKVTEHQSTDETEENLLATKQGIVIGTPGYLSPEQARASKKIDFRSDLYSIGVLGYALLTGANPFQKESTIETIIAHCHHPVPSLPPELNIPPELEAALTKALEKSPEARFSSAIEMAQTLRNAFPEVTFPTSTRAASIVRSSSSISPVHVEGFSSKAMKSATSSRQIEVGSQSNKQPEPASDSQKKDISGAQFSPDWSKPPQTSDEDSIAVTSYPCSS